MMSTALATHTDQQHTQAETCFTVEGTYSGFFPDQSPQLASIFCESSPYLSGLASS